eukprot:13219504-Heterocapsa_arctica.AAC.1
MKNEWMKDERHRCESVLFRQEHQQDRARVTSVCLIEMDTIRAMGLMKGWTTANALQKNGLSMKRE